MQHVAGASSSVAVAFDIEHGFAVVSAADWLRL